MNEIMKEKDIKMVGFIGTSLLHFKHQLKDPLEDIPNIEAVFAAYENDALIRRFVHILIAGIQEIYGNKE